MALAGELASFIISWVQELGVVAGMGAVTITLVGHLLSLHARVPEATLAYVRAARQVRAAALAFIIVSGVVAVVLHFQGGTPATILAPAFVFKWILIGILTAFYFLELDARGYYQDAIEGLEGANWYALFIVHLVAPLVGWGLLLGLYGAWLVAFGALWAAFVWFMRRQSTLDKPVPAPVTPSAPPAAPTAPIAPAPNPAPMPAAQPKPVSAPAAPPASKSLEIHANHTLLPIVAELDLPAPKPSAPTPEPKPVPAAPAEASPAVQAPAAAQKPEVKMTNLDETLPGLSVMPQRPEDINTANRSSPVKFE